MAKPSIFCKVLLILAVCWSSVRCDKKKNAACFVVSKRGNCPSVFLNPGKEICSSSAQCEGNRVCCYGGTNQSRCSDPLQSKADQCPPPGQLKKIGDVNCLLDSDCPADSKCCRETPCSYFCSHTVKPTLQINVRQGTGPLKCNFPVPSDARCPEVLIGTTPAPTPCITNAQCAGLGKARMCCSDFTGTRTCSSTRHTKIGTCPTDDIIVTDGALNCLLDSNCPGNQLCCPQDDGCAVCSDPTPPPGTPGCFQIDKHGVCPAVLVNEGITPCIDNAQCPGNQLCCTRSLGNGKRCSDPFSAVIGQCPKPSLVNTATSCYIDSDCSVGEKCCPLSNCSYFCTPVAGGQNDEMDLPPSPFKFGVCPLWPINPTVVCSTNVDCPGRQLCCGGRCSGPSTSKNGHCPVRNQVPRGPANCFTDENCSGIRRKCCSNDRYDYFCAWSV